MLWRRTGDRHDHRTDLIAATATATGAFRSLILGTIVSATACTPALTPVPDHRIDPTEAVPLDEASDASLAEVIHVVDGDTVIVSFDGEETTVRLIGIDTPETVRPNSPIECFGPEASAALHTLLPEGSTVRVLRDVEARDRYGRLLGYLFRVEDDLFVNLELVRSGHADLATYPPNTAFVADLARARHDAKASLVGRWGTCEADGGTGAAE